MLHRFSRLFGVKLLHFAIGENGPSFQVSHLKAIFSDRLFDRFFGWSILGLSRQAHQAGHETEIVFIGVHVVFIYWKIDRYVGGFARLLCLTILSLSRVKVNIHKDNPSASFPHEMA